MPHKIKIDIAQHGTAGSRANKIIFTSMTKKFQVFIILTIILLLSGCSLLTATNNPEHITKSIDFSNQATAIMNRDGTKLEAQEMKQVINFEKSALNEARLVDINALNKHYDNFGDNWRDKYIKGLELFIEGIEENNNEKSLSGQVLLDKYYTWYSANIDKIQKK